MERREGGSQSHSDSVTARGENRARFLVTSMQEMVDAYNQYVRDSGSTTVEIVFRQTVRDREAPLLQRQQGVELNVGNSSMGTQASFGDVTERGAWSKRKAEEDAAMEAKRKRGMDMRGRNDAALRGEAGVRVNNAELALNPPHHPSEVRTGAIRADGDVALEAGREQELVGDQQHRQKELDELSWREVEHLVQRKDKELDKLRQQLRQKDEKSSKQEEKLRQMYEQLQRVQKQVDYLQPQLQERDDAVQNPEGEIEQLLDCVEERANQWEELEQQRHEERAEQFRRSRQQIRPLQLDQQLVRLFATNRDTKRAERS